ncbi:mannosyltransferase putative-domain-containing protein [Parachaetomium inaequale]|uniref:Mannosyltransferase putative-domain-containing protein n=1 Tax=Parachaetomium inaequale TaxID=2588326 RepID=A0AAN6PI23_9PEZI|nr:mannosyltransferase putative-domain-containing protein [Parachaetomium inaequale]
MSSTAPSDSRPLTAEALLAVALVCLVAFVTFHNRDALVNLRDHGYLSPNRTPTHSQKTAQPDPEAHKLPSADPFRAHFAAVTRLKGVTMAEAKATCHWPQGEYVDFQFDADREWVVKDRSDEEIEARRKLGVVVLAGNHDTVMRLKVFLRRLVQLRSKIPVEIHYWDDEMTEDNLKDLGSIYQPVSFNDLSKPHNILHIKDGLLINFQLKSAALVNSKFAEPLLLDSDNIPVLDPATLYDSRVYKEYRTVFWPDIARSWPHNPAWAITNTPCRMDEYEQESGQLMVDKRHYWYHLQLASWLNNEQGSYYNEFLLGDKDMFRFAWHALKTNYGRPKKWLTSVGNLNDGYYCGHSFAQHHPDDGRVAFLHGGLVKSVSLEVMRWNKEERGGYFQHYKRAASDEDPATNVHVQIIWDQAEYVPNHTKDFQVAMCTDMKDIKVRDLDEILPGWEKDYEELGGFWMLEQETKAKADVAGGAPAPA